MNNDVNKILENIFAYAFDKCLWSVFYLNYLEIPLSPYYTSKSSIEADKLLEKYNFSTLKNSICEAKRRGLIQKTGRGIKSMPEITAAGKARLSALLPKYDDKRVWDKTLYLLTYDIPEKRHSDRDKLRNFARAIGCSRLQDSVWVTPYDPRQLTDDFIRQNHIFGTIIVSNIGRDGSIGNEDIIGLICRVYKLAEINVRYENWIQKFSNRSSDQLALLEYFGILKDDPQLPFSLLPSWWKGDTAFNLIKSHIKDLFI
jgi:DNA-binding transcriptional regulator PaaX